MPGSVRLAGTLLGPAAMPHSACHHRGLGVTLKWKALLPLTRPRDNPARWVFPSLWLQKVGGDREKTRAIFMGRGWTGLRGTAATEGSGVSRKLFVQGCSKHLV